MNAELFEAYWEDRGGDCAADDLRERKDITQNPEQLAVVLAEDLNDLDFSDRISATAALLRGYRVKLARLIGEYNGRVS